LFNEKLYFLNIVLNIVLLINSLVYLQVMLLRMRGFQLCLYIGKIYVLTGWSI